MIVKQIWTDNSYRNFNYLIACPETGEALAIDPLDHGKCLQHAKDAGWRITQVLNTHEHRDHIGGNEALIAATGAKLLAHRNAKDKIPGIDRGLSAGDVITVGKTVELEAMDTPGHTQCHICLRARGDHPAIFSGDTLFNAGAGNCRNGGHPDALYQTFARQFASLPLETKLYPGHDYIANNLRFTLDCEPDNPDAQTLLDAVQEQDPVDAYVSTIGDEMKVNTFFRLQSHSLMARLRAAFPDLPGEPDERTVFIKLRELRDKW